MSFLEVLYMIFGARRHSPWEPVFFEQPEEIEDGWEKVNKEQLDGYRANTEQERGEAENLQEAIVKYKQVSKQRKTYLKVKDKFGFVRY